MNSKRLLGTSCNKQGQRSSLMQVASEHIAPLQDAVDLEIATEEENSLLEAWKKYRVLLNRVDTSTAPDIEWPVIPEV
ncbi:tail fiber assembly protein [Escherichia coli]|nr:tail fiber assembly protein [Escherichia coli]